MKALASRSVLSLCMALLLAGCGGGDDGGSVDKLDTVPAAGTVTVDGQPANDVVIELIPGGQDRARSASGQVHDGEFTLGTYDDDDGAAPGKYTVRLTSMNIDSMPPAVEAQEVTIPAEGNTELKIDLKTSADAGGDLLSPNLP